MVEILVQNIEKIFRLWHLRVQCQREQSTENRTKSRTFLCVVFGAWRFIEYVSVFPPLQQHLVSKIGKECSNFKALPDANGDVDQLRWWQAYQEQFPQLSYPVRVVFALPAANSKSERVFSVAGNMVSSKRNRVAPQQV